MADSKIDLQALPDWWQREKQRRNARLLLLLVLLLALIAYFYYQSSLGITGHVGGITFDTSDHVAFVRQQPDGSTDLYAIRADGSDLRQLTTPDDKSEKSAPAWTLDGKNLVYSSNRGDSKKTQLFILGSEQPVQLTYGAERKDDPLPLPDGKHIAFITQGAIKTVYLNGNEVEQLLPSPRAGNEGSGDSATPGQPELNGPYHAAAFSSDGLSVAGVETIGSDNNVDAGDLEGQEVARALAAGATYAGVLNYGRSVDLQWEPGGKRLIVSYTERALKDPSGQYIKYPDGKYVYANGISIWSFDNPNRPVESPLVISEGISMMPRRVAWSPDGTKLAFEGWMLTGDGESKLRGIYVFPMPKDFNKPPFKLRGDEGAHLAPTLAASADGVPADPKWSPDGSHLLFELQRPDNRHDLCVVSSDMTNLVNLTKGIGDNIQAAWAPAKKLP